MGVFREAKKKFKRKSELKHLRNLKVIKIKRAKLSSGERNSRKKKWKISKIVINK